MRSKAQESLEYLLIAVVAIVLVAGSYIFISSQSTAVSDYSEMTTSTASAALCDADIYFCSSPPASIAFGGTPAGDASPIGNTWTYHMDNSLSPYPEIEIIFDEPITGVDVEINSEIVVLNCIMNENTVHCTYPKVTPPLKPGRHTALVEAVFENGKRFRAKIMFNAAELQYPEFFDLPITSMKITQGGIEGTYEKEGEIKIFNLTPNDVLSIFPSCMSGVRGDLDGNGVVNAVDIMMISNEIVRLTEYYKYCSDPGFPIDFCCFDLSGDNKITVLDGIIAQELITQRVSELSKYPVLTIELTPDSTGTVGTYEKENEIVDFETKSGDFLYYPPECGILGDVDANGLINMVDVQMIIDESLNVTNRLDQDLCGHSYASLQLYCHHCFDLDDDWDVDETDIQLALEAARNTCSARDGSICESYEVCEGEVLEATDTYRCCSGECRLPETFDWRNRHGKPWLSSVKRQVSNSCIYFAWIGAVESQILLHYNQEGTIFTPGISNPLKWKIDLSEQMLLDCMNGGYGVYEGQIPELKEARCIEGGCYADEMICRMMKIGIPDEECDEDRSAPVGCQACTYDHVCTDYAERTWKISDYAKYIFDGSEDVGCEKEIAITDPDELKALLIENGPMFTRISTKMHAMVLAGYDGQTNWRTVEWCDWMCADQECIPRKCDNLGEEMSFCNNWNNPTIDDYFSGKVYTYKCEENQGTKHWAFVKEESCGSEKACIHGECNDKDLFELTLGDRKCTTWFDGSVLASPETSRFFGLSEYRPGDGDVIWIFKNSMGIDYYGSNPGYIIEPVSLFNMAEAILPLGPITPPSNQNFWPGEFDNQINCVDEDGDNFCNWGITKEMPDTCPENCLSEKDWDDSNPDIGALAVY